MPLLIIISLLLVGLSAVQSVVNAFVAMRVEPTEMALLFLIHAGLLAILMAGMAYRQDWARLTFVLLAVAGVASGTGLFDASGFEPSGYWAWAVIRGLCLGPGVVQLALHAAAVVLLLLPDSSRWFRASSKQR